MKARFVATLAMISGIGIGAVAVQGLNAQGTSPGAYAVVDISEVTDADAFKTLLPKAPGAAAVFGGKFIIRTENITPHDGAPPKRFIVIAFDSMEKAKGWSTSVAQKEVDDIRMKSTKSREFLVEGFSQ